MKKDKVRRREGWEAVPFIVNDRLFEVKSTYILQPGPAALTEGVRQLHAVLCRAAGVERADGAAAAERWDDGTAARPAARSAP